MKKNIYSLCICTRRRRWAVDYVRMLCRFSGPFWSNIPFARLSYLLVINYAIWNINLPVHLQC